MHITWIKMGGLWPLNTGGRQRTFQILSALSARHRVSLLTTAGPDDDADGLARALPQCDRVTSIPFRVPKVGSATFAAALARSWASPDPVDLWKWRVPAVRDALMAMTASDCDVIVADFMFATPNVPASAPAPVVFFSHNVEHQIWQRLAAVETRSWRRGLLEIEWRKMRRAEAAVVRRAQASVAVSDADADALRKLAPGASVDVIPTGVDTDYFAPVRPARQPHRLVFSGSMDWYPNEDAIQYMADRLWPALRAACPDVAMTVVGRSPTPRLREVAARAGIDVTGTVDDVRPFIDEAAVYVVPLRVGGGTRLKIFEALAMAKPVVSTTLGAEGLGLESGRHYLAADRDDDFVAAILGLFADPRRASALGDEGRRLVKQRYSWPSVARVFERALDRAIRGAYDHTAAPTHRLAVPRG